MKETKYDFQQANARKREIGNRLNQLAEKLESNEELTEKQREDMNNESIQLRSELQTIEMRNAAALANMAADGQQNREVVKTKEQVLREFLRDVKDGKRQEREISLSILNTGDQNNIRTAGAVALNIKDLMPRLSEGMIFGKVGMQVQTGVTGDILWPYAVDNVKMSEVGETVQLQDQKINFANVKAEPARIGATISVTYEAIDDASFDLMGFIQESLQLAQADYLNEKSFSHANFTGIKGPWAGKAKATTLVGTYANILAAKAELINAGVNMAGFCYVMDAATEAELKSTPKDPASGQGFIISNGTLDGDPYFVSHYIRQTAAGTQSTDKYLGLGVWSYFAANQHGDVRLVVDPYTLADKGMLKLTVNTRWSLTTLRPEAFALYKFEAAPRDAILKVKPVTE